MAQTTPQAPRAKPSGRHNPGRGVFIVAVLAAVFFTLLTLIVVVAGKRRSAPDRATDTLTVVPQRIRIRTEADAKAPVVATAIAGDRLTLLEDRGAWVEVKTSDGLTGWAERSGLERTVERERRLARFASIRKLPALEGIVRSNTPLYAGPGIFYPILGTLGAETKVKVYTRDHDFYAVDAGDKVAYADIDEIDVTASGAQLEVSGANVPPATSTLPPATESTASAAPPDLPTETPAEAPVYTPAEPVQPESSSRVYAAVPPGGTQPEELSRPVPVYPPMARRLGASGAVVVRGIVRRDGSIDEVEVIKNQPYGLGEAARDAVRRWRFRPATYNGDAIDVYYTVTVNFRLAG
jgi:protein TonB